MHVDWIHCNLGDVLTLQRGFDLPERDRQAGEIPIISSSGITGFHNTAKVRAPGVVTGRYGTLGEVFYIKEDFWPLNTSLYVRDFKGNSPLFISYFLRTLNFAHQNAAGAVPGLNRNALHLLPVYIPPLPIQNQIASILSAYDNLIENNTRRIAILEETARTLYDEWFVKFRFPGHEQVQMVESEMGMIPEGWSIRKLGEVLTLQRGFDLPASQREPGRVPVYAATGVNGYHDEVKVKGPGVITGRSGSLGTVLYVKEDFWPLNTTLWVKSFHLVSPIYAFYLLSAIDFPSFNSGAAVPTLNRNDLHLLNILLPPKALIQNLDEYLLSVFEQKHNLIYKNANLRRTRDRLLPKLISGEIDISSWVAGGEDEEEMVVAGVARVAAREPEPVVAIDAAAVERPLLWG